LVTFTHAHDPRYLEPDCDEDGAQLLYPNPHGFGTVAEFVPFTPYTITFRPYETPLSEIPAALGGTLRRDPA
jgi:hypothetical protein